ncbi:ZIP family metal transporter [Porphyromonadaceae sp. NP-X]|jgi:zinc and cadmium transporter|nr:ZIP family metal transporter [Paludibacteraceae bacterium]MBP9016416.1 ZIP family metal transporter [Paludibacteraceae bacterium]MDS1031683.1 ZIP family metal transporter [Porphyromonadaceae sp. NP-X]
MTQSFIFTVIALFLGSVGSVLLAGLILLIKEQQMQRITHLLTYLAGGTLLGSALLGMIPEASGMMEIGKVLSVVLVGIIFFFVLEKIILWRVCSDASCERNFQAAAPMVLFGDAFHNAIDGVIIAAAFLTSNNFGWIVTLSVVFHEVPQELGDFGILLRSGMKRSKALLYNALSGASALLLGILAYFSLNFAQSLIPYALAFSAASFLYIALADLIPEMHRKTSFKESIVQIFFILLGIMLIYFFGRD